MERAETSAWPARLRNAGRLVLDLLYPPRCAGCGRAGDVFCPACQAQVIPMPPACIRCGRPRAEGGLCPSCRRTPSPIDAICSSAVFAPPLRTAIHHFKYQNRRGLAEPLGARLVELWGRAGLSADAIVPVPLHASRLAERGYNQSALLAQVLTDAVGVAVLDDLLVRQRDTPAQTHLSKPERSRNVSGAFACRRDISGMRIILIDDVCTTGATLEACAAALRARGAAGVSGLTVARPHWDPGGDGPELS